MGIIIFIYIAFLVGTHIGIMITNFKRPKGLWNLIPFRVSGWREDRINWVWENPTKY